MATWATIEDLYKRYGDEFMDKLSTRMDDNTSGDDYVANEDPLRRDEVIQLALDDARAILLQKINCCFKTDGKLVNPNLSFSGIFPWHIKLTIILLKQGGDCKDCDDCKEAFDDFCKCSSICSDEGDCLEKRGSAISVSEEKFKCDDIFKDGCCKC